MKKPLLIFLFSTVLLPSFFSQNHSVDLGFSRTLRWHFMNTDYHYTWKNGLDLKLGLGLNVTQYFNENYFHTKLFIHPLSEKFTDRFSVNYGIRKYFQLKEPSARWFLSYDHSLMKSKFIYKSSYVVDNVPYYAILITDKGFLFNHSISVGLDTKLSSNLRFNCAIGINQIINESIRSRPFKLRFQVGFNYCFKKRVLSVSKD